MTQISEIRVSDVRTASADVSGMPILRTATGKSPISPLHVRVTYSITRNEVLAVIINGTRLDGEGVLTRRIASMDDAPRWVRKFVTEHAPTPTARWVL